MSDYCFVHAADLHLGGRRWLRSTPVDRQLARRVALADRLALRALVDLCQQERARLLLLAGDIVDGWCRNHAVGLWLVQELLRLREGACQVVLLLGNHDVRARVLNSLLLPDHAHLLGRRGPETLVLEELGVALHGWSAPEIGGSIDVAELYPARLEDLFNIGLLHTSADGRRGHENYAPCSRWTLRRKGYDYWALGHVHTREVVATEPWIVFPGNLQARGMREAGPKGATLVRVRGRQVVGADHRSLDALRFATVVVDTARSRHLDDLLDVSRVALLRAAAESEGRPLVTRLVLSGVEGAACSLAASPHVRTAALRTLKRELCWASIWIDEAWVDTGVGSWLLDAAA